ncbi:MAG: ferredoxin domain-containing protein [Candidatus Xenobiia bacterium LiM19]
MKILENVAEFMELAARTAPKSAGQDYISTAIVKGPDVQKLAEAMVKYGSEKGKKNFDRDGENVRNSEAVLLIGLKDAKPVGLNCGACGSSCSNIKSEDHGEFAGPHCSFRILDMGIALGSAVKTAQLFNADNRIMYRIGVAARLAGFVDWDFVMGIPLSARGKNIYFDR